MSMNQILNTAINYANKGVKIVPFGLNKKPLFKNWPNSASCDPNVVSMWWSKAFPNALIAAPTGNRNGFWVFDVDGKEGIESLVELEKQHGEFHNSWAVQTPSGGLHLYFNMPEGKSIKSSAGVIAPNIDIRGDGGAIILPGSVRKDGKYTIIKDWRKLLCN